MPLTPNEIEDIAARTLAHYDASAQDFWEGTRDHDVSQNIDALLRSHRGDPPFALLDFGCGPGRDLKAFRQLGHHAVGLEGAARLAAMARALQRLRGVGAGFPAARSARRALRRRVRQRIAVPCARQELPRVLRELHAALKPGGVLFSSNPRGDAGRLERRPLWRVSRLGPGAPHGRPPASWNSRTTTVRRACRASSSRGWRASGASRLRDGDAAGPQTPAT